MIIFLISLILFFSNSLFSDLKLLNEPPIMLGEKIILDVYVIGINLGTQILYISNQFKYNGYNVIYGFGQLLSSDFISKFYPLNDVEITYFLPNNFIPIYYTKFFREGKWTNRTEYFFDPISNKISYYDEYMNSTKIFETTNTIRNYFSLIACLRSLDYDYYIKNNLPIKIEYITVNFIKNSTFIAKYGSYKYKNNTYNAIFIEEQGGIEMTAVILNDKYRTPILLIIPALKVVGFRTINVYVELKEYIPGTKKLISN